MNRSVNHSLWVFTLAAGMIATPSQASAQLRSDTTLSIDASATVEIISRGGDIRVRTGADRRLVVRSDNGDARTLVSGSGRSLRIDASRERARGDVDLSVELPRGTVVLLRTQNGDISVGGTGADVEVRSTSGDINVTDARQLRIANVAGDISARNITDGVRISTTSGDITLDNITGDVEVAGTSSDVTLRDITSRRVQVEVVSGDVYWAGAFDDAGRYEFNAHSGDVRLQVPNNARALLDVQTFNGEVSTTDLPLTLLPSPGASPRDTTRDTTREQQRDRERQRVRERDQMRDSLRRVLSDSMRRSNTARDRRDTASWERNLERSVSQLVESVLSGVAEGLSSMSFSFSDAGNSRVRRFQLGAAGGPLVSVSTFSGNIVVGSTNSSSRRR